MLKKWASKKKLQNMPDRNPMAKVQGLICLEIYTYMGNSKTDDI